MSRFVLTAQLQLQAPNNVAQVVQQIQNQLQNVQVNVQVQGVQQANRQTRQLAQNLDVATDSAGRLGRVFAVSVRRFTALAVATRAVSLLTNTLSSAIQEAIDFERELIKVSQVTGRTLVELRDLTDAITNLSTGFGVSSQSLLQVTTILAQAGLNANETKIALDTLAKSALAPNFDSLSETTEGAIAILAQFKQGVGALEAQLGSIDAVAGAFAVEAGDLIDVVRRAGGVFKSSGGSLNELLALFTSVRATTRESAESIGTGLRTIFTRIQRPQTIEFLKQFGVELVDLNGKFVGPFEAVRRLSDALAGLGEGDLTFIRVAEELGGFRQIGKVLPLLQQFTLAQQALNVAQEGGAGLTKNAESAQAALAVRITKVKEEFLALVRSITETSSFQIMANTALNLASALLKIGEALKPVLPLLTALAAIKVARGLGSFLGGIGSGLGSARGFNQGGEVLAFAKGGLVPGSGNKDTVPAMLTPGEFVMKKSAVQSMGASTLKSMNQNRFRRGGPVPIKITGDSESTPTIGQIAPTGSPGIKKTKNVKTTLGDVGIKPQGKETEKTPAALQANVKNITLGEESGPFSYDEVVKPGLQFIDEGIKMALQSVGIKKQAQKIVNDKAAQNVVSGYAFESFAAGLAGKSAEGGSSDFDFINPGQQLSKYTQTDPTPRLLDAKNTLQPAAAIAQKAFGYKKRNPSAIQFRRANLGGFIQKFAIGGIAQRNLAGVATPDTFGDDNFKSSPIAITTSEIASATPQVGALKSGNLIKTFAFNNRKTVDPTKPNVLPSSEFKQVLQSTYGFGSKTYTSKTSGIDTSQKQTFNNILTNQMQEAIKNGASQWSQSVGVPLSPSEVSFGEQFKLAPGLSGSFFESVVDAFEGRPIGAEASENKRPFDFISGLRGGANARLFPKLNDVDYIDAKKSANLATDAEYEKKIAGQLAIDGFDEVKAAVQKRYQTLLNSQSKGSDNVNKKYFGGIIQKFASGGMATKMPLVDDIENATGTIPPRPSLAIARLLQSGGGAVDIDRTIKRTIGDKAYGSAKTDAQRGAALNTFFRDDAARLRDVKTAPLTQFGQELQSIIKSGKLDGRRVSIISKSKRVPGIAEYLSQLFSIPTANMVFTSGGSKEPAMEAMRTKGPRVDRVRKFFGGEIQRFAQGGQPRYSWAENKSFYDAANSKRTSYDVFEHSEKGGAKVVYRGSFDDVFKFLEQRRAQQKAMKAMPQQPQKFATGGVVPGSGNRDTVPAVLQQGDFVIRKSSVKKIGTDNLASMAGYATGGGVDKSVPALLTPGEFVFSKSQAQSIGYGKLNRMNKVGKYAKGGSVGVKKFATGGRSSASGGSGNMFGGFGTQLTLVTASLQAMIPPADENAGAMTRLANSALSLGTTIGSVIFALEAFGVSLTKSSVAKFFGSGAGGAGDLIAGVRKGGTRSIGSGFQQQFALGQKESSASFAQSRQARAAALREERASPFQLNETFAERRQRRRTDTASLNINRGPKAQGLTGQLGRFLGQQATGGGVTGRVASLAARGISSAGSAIGGIGGGAVGGFASAAVAATGPLLAIAGIAATVDLVVGAFRDLDGQLKDAIKAQDSVKAQQLAVSKSNADSIPIIGNLVGGFADLIGQGDLLADGLAVIGGQTSASIKSTIAAQIATTKANESLKKASEESATALQDLQNGTISAAEGLAKVTALTADANTARNANTQAIRDQSDNRSTGFRAGLRNILTLGGTFGESSSEKNRRIAGEQEKLADENIRLQKESLDAQRPLIQATARSTFASGGNITDAKAAIQAAGGATPEALIQESADLERQKREASARGDKGTVAAIEKQQQNLIQSAEQLEKGLLNLDKEVGRTYAAMKAMNLGLQSVAATAEAGVLGLNNYLAAQEYGNNRINQTISVLEAGITSAAQGISDADFGNALSAAGESLLELGATPEQVRKAQGNIQAVNAAQRQFPSVLVGLRKTLEAQLGAGGVANLAPDAQKNIIGQVLSQQLAAAGIDDLTRKAFDDQFKNINLDGQAIAQLLEGNLSVLEGPLKEIGEGALKQLIPILKQQAEAQDSVNKLMKTRLDLENKLVSAQRARLDIELEAAEIIGKYGGPAVTPQTRTQNALAQANVQSQGVIPTQLRTGSAQEFNNRNRDINARLRQIQDTRRIAAMTPEQAAQAGVREQDRQAAQAQMSNESGLQLQAQEQRLLELAKSDYETTKLLIKQKEAELELIGQKNKAEKDSIDALLSGDIDKFFEQQATVGATAAIASGDQRLAGMFGGQALGAAAQDIRRQQEAGVQTLFGRQLGGAGGLTQSAFGTALGAAGVTDPRMAQVAAGTTGEELAIQADIRGLATTLTNFGNTQVAAAQSELDTAKIQLNAANIQLQAARDNVAKRQTQAQSTPAVPMAQQNSTGGLIYASKGTLVNFKPRGTDTVPAMLTPGEFVVRREAVNRGNNLQLLKAINNGSANVRAASGESAGLSRGGPVKYYAQGGNVQGSAAGSVNIGIDTDTLTRFSTALENFNSQLSQNITNLQNTKFQIALSPTNINVNLTGTSFLANLTETIKRDLITFVGEEIRNYAVGNDGKLRRSGSTLGTVT